MRKLASLLSILALVAAAPLHAQRTTYSSYVAADGGVRGDPMLVGVTAGAEVSLLAIRVGLAMDPQLERPDPGAGGPHGVWSTEADALLYLKNPAGDATLIPYAVAGMGLRSFRLGNNGPIAGMLSYGGGVRVPLLGPVALEGEGRYRRPLAEGPEYLPEGISSGFEARVGLSFRRGLRREVRVPVSLPAAPRPAVPSPIGSRIDAAGSSSRRAVARGALETADDYLGVRYQWGGNTPASGFDCSGFIRYVYAQHGVELPRVSRDQARAGEPLPLDLAQMEPGDLMAFASKGSRVDHVAIYVGDGRILHASASGGAVRFDDLHSQRGAWYLQHWVAARRVIPSIPTLTQ